MKKSPTDAEDRPQPTPRGARRSRCFDADLRRRGAAEKTRRAYGDRPRPVRALGDRAGRRAGRRRRRGRCAATPPTLSERAARRRDGRAQARGAARALPRAARARRRRRRTRPTCCPRPSARATLPRVLRPDEVAGAARPHPGVDAARAARPRAVRARLRAAACAPRSSSTLDVGVGRLRRRGAARRGQGLARRGSCRPASPRCAAVARYLERARPALAERRRRRRRCSSRSPGGGCRRPTCAAACASGRGTPRLQGGVSPARAAPLVRDAPARGRRRPARDPGAARATPPSRRPRSTLG